VLGGQLYLEHWPSDYCLRLNKHKYQQIFVRNELEIFLKKRDNNAEGNKSKFYPSRLSSIAALYWEGISINAARANAASFREGGMFFDISSVKFTN